MPESLSRSEIEGIARAEVRREVGYMNISRIAQVVALQAAQSTLNEFLSQNKLNSPEYKKMSAELEARFKSELAGVKTECENRLEEHNRRVLNELTVEIRAPVQKLAEEFYRKEIKEQYAKVTQEMQGQIKDWIQLEAPTITQEQVEEHIIKILEKEKTSPKRILHAIRRNRWLGAAGILAIACLGSFLVWRNSKTDVSAMRDELNSYKSESDARGEEINVAAEKRIELISGSFDRTKSDLEKRLADKETFEKGLASELERLKASATGYKAEIKAINEKYDSVIASQGKLQEYADSLQRAINNSKLTYEQFEKGSAKKEDVDRAFAVVDKSVAAVNSGVKDLTAKLDVYDKNAVKVVDYNTDRDKDRKEHEEEIKKYLNQIELLRKEVKELRDTQTKGIRNE